MIQRFLILGAILFFSFTPLALAQQGTVFGQSGNTQGGTGTVFGTSGNTLPPSQGGPSVQLENPLGTTDLKIFILRILDFVIYLGSIIVIFMLVYVGFLFVKARGNPDGINDAKSALLWTVVGALVLLGSKAIALGIEATVKALSVGN